MNCRETGKWLWPLAEGNLPEGQAARVRRHLAGCPSCSRSFAGIADMLSHLQESRKVTANPFLYTRILQRLEDGNTGKAGLVKRLRPALLAGLSLAAAVFLGISLVLHSGWHARISSQDLISFQEETNEFLAGDIGQDLFTWYDQNANTLDHEQSVQ